MVDVGVGSGGNTLMRDVSHAEAGMESLLNIQMNRSGENISFCGYLMSE